MTYTRRNSSIPKSPRAGFTLIELLIVLAIIGLLAAILFPAFRRAQEGGAQASCASNLKQIYQAVELYRQDEKVYPASLGVLLPDDSKLSHYEGTALNINGDAAQACDTGAMTCPNPQGTGYFKGGNDGLVCNDDDTDPALPRSSYGDISVDITKTVGTDKTDMARYVWNYWGYRPADVTANCTSTDVTGCAGTAYQTSDEAITAIGAGGFDTTLLFDPTPANKPTNFDQLKKNPLKYSLANRFAPTSTIITHCVYHRLPTASGRIAFPYEMTTDPTNGAMARDIVLRRDGSAKVLDVSKFHENGNWAKQNF